MRHSAEVGSFDLRSIRTVNLDTACLMTVSVNYPLGNVPWIESPFFEAILPQMGLTAEQEAEARTLQRDGYVTFPLDFPDFDAAARRIVDDLTDRYGSDRRIQDAWAFQDDVRRIVAHPEVLDRLRRYYRREPIPFQTLNFRIGTEQPLHSDLLHFSSVPERFMVGVWVALEDIDADNGPLEYVPGSHRLPSYVNEHIGVVGSEDKSRYENTHYRDLWARLVKANGLERRTLEVAKGTALLWTANLLHGGARQNDRTRTRHSMVVHYYFENCVYYTPFLSDPFLGRIAYRTIRDIRTGEVVPNIYNGRVVPEAVVDALDTYRGLNAVGRTGSSASRLHAGLPLLDLAEPRIENVVDGGFVREDGRFLLHPGEVGAAPARLVLADVDVPAGSLLSGRVALPSEESLPVRFTVSVVGADRTETWEKDVAAGEDLVWTIDPTPRAAPVTIILSTAMAPDGLTNAFAWAFWISWLLLKP